MLLEVGKLVLYAASSNIPGTVTHILSQVLGAQMPDILIRYNTEWENLSSKEVNQQFYSSYASAGLLKAVDASTSSVRWKRLFKVKKKMLDGATGFLGAFVKQLYYDIKGSAPTDFSNGVSYGSMVTSFLLAAYYDLTKPDIEFYHQIFGFGEYYGHYLADRKYGIQADAVKAQDFTNLSSSSGESSHKRFLETWKPTVSVDFEKD